MARYDVLCPAHGIHEVVRSIHDARPFRCEAVTDCTQTVVQHFSPSNLPNARIDAGGEDSPLEGRRADGTHVFNMGLRGVETVVGTRPDGKPKLAYRPITNHEVGSNANARELGKRAGLIPMGGGRYRPLGR